MKAYSNKNPLYELRTQSIDVRPEDFVNAEKIQGLTASFFGIELKDILRPNRRRHVKETRHVIAYMVRKHTRLPLTKIAPYMGLKDHTSVIYAFRNIADLMIAYPEYEARVSELESYILPIVKD